MDTVAAHDPVFVDAISSLKNEGDTQEETPSSLEPPADSSEPTSVSKVSFGNVNVHKHRMTLSNNPSATYGVPVELAWDEESSELLTVDQYEKDHEKKDLHRMTAGERQQIAAVNHTRESITERLQEVYAAKQSISTSAAENPDDQAEEQDEESPDMPIIKRGINRCCVIQ